MSDRTADFFQELSTRGREPRLRNVTGTVRFDVTQDGRTEQWWLRIDRGDVRVSTGGAETDRPDPDCVMGAQRTVFDGVVTGEVNAMAAMLRGDLAVQGDLALVVACQRLFPTRSHTTSGAPAEVGRGRTS
jgi:SCP-2 sterol transfer family